MSVDVFHLLGVMDGVFAVLLYKVLPAFIVCSYDSVALHTILVQVGKDRFESVCKILL